MKATDKSRFDTRIPAEQKALFEQAAALGGFRTLTDFMLHAAQLQADKILEKHQTILATRQDQEIFFDAILQPRQPNAALQAAAEKYQETIRKK